MMMVEVTAALTKIAGEAEAGHDGQDGREEAKEADEWLGADRVGHGGGDQAEDDHDSYIGLGEGGGGGGRRVGILTSRLGVMESLDLSISQAGVEETNLEKMEEGEAGEGGQEDRES